MSTKAAAIPKNQTQSRIRTIAAVGLLIALTYVFTAFVNIRLPIMGNGGLIHLGNIPLLIGAILFGRRISAMAGGIGMALFDVTAGWLLWAPFTLVLVSLMGYTVGGITERKKGMRWYLLAVLAAMVIKIVGYYIAEGLIYGNWLVPLGSIPGNILQVAVAALLVLPVSDRIRKAREVLV